MNKASTVFSSVIFIPDWVNGHYIQWELDTFFKGARPYNFFLQISENLDFKEILATKKNLGEVFYAIDDFKLKQSWSPNYIYRVGFNTADGKTYYSHPLFFGNTKEEGSKYAMAAEVIRKEILMARYAGSLGWLLKRKTYTTKKDIYLHKNVDPVSGVPIADTKFEDYGTGIDDGYFAPIPCAYYLEAASQDKQLDPQGIGVKENYVSNIRLSGYPLVDVRDIICSPDGAQRYSIQAMNGKNFPGTNITILQKATLVLIPSTDTIYSIDLPIPLYT
jgi:hypothetical protein